MFIYKVFDDHFTVLDGYSGMESRHSIDFGWYGITPASAESFLASLCEHITNVREAGEKIGVMDRQLQNHDLSKFSLEEFPHYARNFFGDKADPDGFAGAWLNHIHQNPHHWQHWIFPDGFTPKGSTVENGCVEMPNHYALEMVADWMGASKTYTGSWDIMEWLYKNMPKIRVHSKTASHLRGILDSLGYADVVHVQRFAHEVT